MSYDPRYAPQQGYPQQGAPQGGYAPQHGGSQGGIVDDFAMPDAAAWQQQVQEQQESNERARNGPQPRFVKHQPPRGRDSWKDSAVGERVDTWIWLCPVYDRTKPLFHQFDSHFGYVKGAPNGKRLACAGDDCLICAAWYEVRYSKNQKLKPVIRATRKQTEYLYNVVHCSNDEDHNVKYQEQTLRRAAILTLKTGAHNQLNNILRIQGPQITHPLHGAPIAYTRLRKSAEEYGFEYGLAAGSPKPLPHRHPQLWHDLCRGEGLWNLEQLNPIPTPQDQIAFLKGIGAPIPHMARNVASAPAQHQEPQQAQQGYGGPPGFDDPYQGPPQAQPNYPPQGQQHPPQGHGPTTGRMSGNSPNISSPPREYAAPQAQRPAPPAAQHQQHWDPAQEFGDEPPLQKYPDLPPNQAPSAPPQAAPAPGGIPPAPSVYGAPAANQGPPAPPATYGAQTTPAAPSYAPVAQGSRQQPPQGQQQGQPPRLIRGQTQGTISLPGSRERCFGSHDEGYTRCVECPPWIKDQCIPQTPRGAAISGGDPAGDVMARQLASDEPPF